VLVGKNLRRTDALDKVLGRPLYTTDLIPEGALYVKVVRSSQAHARLLGIRTEQARRYPGVVAVLTAADVPGRNEAVALLPDRPLLATGKVRCTGEAIALVVAEAPEIAEEAVDLVEVDYQPLPLVLDPLDALKPAAPKIHEGGNVARHMKLRKGNVEEGFAQADVILENTYSTQFQEPTPLETEAGLAIPEPDGSVTCVGSMQSPYHTQSGVAKILGLAPSRVRTIQAATGGAFGPKSDEMPTDTCGMAAVAAVKTGRPAVVAYTREESIIAHTKRHPFVIRHKTGATKEGKLLAWEASMYADTGGYASLGPLVIMRALFHAPGAYVVPHVKADAYCVYTNNTMAGSFRGFGAPQAMYAAESQMDELAARLGMDPLDLRLKNLLRPGTRTATNQVLDDARGLEECVMKATEAADWRRKRSAYSQQTGVIRKGIGLAIMYHGNSLGPEGNDYAAVHLSVEDGNVVLRTVLTEYGTGAPAGLLQIAGEILGLPPDRLRLGAADTSLCQDSGPTVASRTILMGGRATQQAARQLRDTLARIAGELLRADPAGLEFAEGRIGSPNSGRSVSIDEIFADAKRRGIKLRETGTYMAPRCEWDHDTGQGTLYLQYTYGAVVAEVEVDTELGWINVTRLTTAYDVGKAINPLSLIGQIEGGTIQGLGYAIMEELVHREGVVQNPNVGDYFIPTSLDLPEIETIIVEHPGPIGPYGAKAMGEPPIVLPAPAIVNALAHATGVRIRELPATPEKLLLGLRRLAAEKGSAPRQA